MVLRIAVGDEDVRELVIDQGEGPAAFEVQMFAVVLAADRQQARLAQQPIGIGHVIDRHDRVFAGRQPQAVRPP